MRGSCTAPFGHREALTSVPSPQRCVSVLLRGTVAAPSFGVVVAGICQLGVPSAGGRSAHQLLQRLVLVVVVEQQNFLYGFALESHLPETRHELQETQRLLL